jgi:hypothetical protein
MRVPESGHLRPVDGDPPTAARQSYLLVARSLTASQTHHTPEFSRQLDLAIEKGARPFEIISGSPSASYGARISLSTDHRGHEIASAFRFDSHPWGPPNWIGIRCNAQGEIVTKPYHRSPVRASPQRMPELCARLNETAIPVMASLLDNSIEVYWRMPGEWNWNTFAQHALEPFGCAPPAVDPQPRPVPGGFCVSYRSSGGKLDAITLFAYDRALPPEGDLADIWEHQLPSADRADYRLALDTARSLGKRPLRGFHAMLAWNVGPYGEITGRAVSLRLPH